LRFYRAENLPGRVGHFLDLVGPARVLFYPFEGVKELVSEFVNVSWGAVFGICWHKFLR